MTEWWQDLFDEKYLRLFAETRTPIHTAQEVEGVKALLAAQGVPAAGQVLDLACGPGRITVPLGEAGYRMTGLDLSEHLLAIARQAAEQAEVSITWHRGDMRTLPVAWQGRFDAVINTFSAFGYFDEPSENQRVLHGVAQVLKPNGIFIIDVAHRDRIMAEYRSSDWFEVDDLLVCVSRAFNPLSGMNTEVWQWVDEQGQRQTLHFKAHVYTATDLTRLLREAGLAPVAHHGFLAAPPEIHPFDQFSRRLVIVAKRMA